MKGVNRTVTTLVIVTAGFVFVPQAGVAQEINEEGGFLPALLPEVPLLNHPEPLLLGDQFMRCDHTGGGICTVGLGGSTDYDTAYIYYCPGRAAYCKYAGDDTKYGATEGTVTNAFIDGNADKYWWSWSCDFSAGGVCDTGSRGDASTYTYLEGTGDEYPSGAGCGSYCDLTLYWGVGAHRKATL